MFVIAAPFGQLDVQQIENNCLANQSHRDVFCLLIISLELKTAVC
jgi:hypothetical protein